MHLSRGTRWGPRPLPELLTAQLADQGFAPTDAASCARQINESSTPAQAAPFFVALGSCKFIEGDIDGAVASWRHAITGDHEIASAMALFNLGLLYEHLHLYDRAVAVLDSTVERGVDPFAADAVMAGARVRRELGDVESAMESMARLTQALMTGSGRQDQLAETLYGVGDLAFDAGRSDRAERAWRAAAAGERSHVQRAAQSRLFALLVEAGRDEELLDVFDVDETLGDISATDLTRVLEQVRALHRAGDDDGAARLALAIDGSTAHEVDRFRIAQVRCELGLINQAIDELEPLLAHSEVHIQQRAAFVLGGIYQDYDMADAAVSMFRRAVEQPDDFWSRKAAISLGDICSQQRNREQSLEYWTFASASPVRALRTIALERLELAYSNPAEPEIGRLDEFDDEDEVEAAAIQELEPAIVLLDDAGASAEQEDLLLEQVGPNVVLLDGLAASDDLVASPQAVSLDDLAPQVLMLDELVDDEPVAMLDELVHDEPVAMLDVPGEVESVAMLDVPGEVESNDVSDQHVDDAIDVDTASAQVVVLDDLATQDGAAAGRETETQVRVEPALPTSDLADSAPDLLTESTPVFSGPISSAFREHTDSNPYASLAPEANDDDPAPSQRNPYAELAPNFDDAELPAGVEPGDWESLLEDWPADAAATTEPPAQKKRPSAFSRYT